MSRAVEYLLTRYNSRKLKNPRYSQRAFAAHLGIHSGRLSQYISGERTISATTGRKIAEKLALDSAETEYFIHLITSDKEATKSNKRTLADDEMALMVEWYHAALLALLTTKDFRPDYSWMAKRLNLPQEVVQASMERLLRIGLVEETDKGIKRKPGVVSTGTDVPSQFLRLSHKDTLRYVIDGIDRVPLEKRDVTSVTFAMDIRKIPMAKKMIRDFRLKLASKLSKGTKTDVVSLSVQLFPFTEV